MEHVEKQIENNNIIPSDVDIEYECDCEENTEQELEEIAEKKEIELAAQSIAQNPRLFPIMIDMVNLLGVAGERRNIGLYAITMDSSLIISTNGSESMACINVGHQGAGKSETLKKVLFLRSENRYYILSNSTAKGLYNLRDSLKHKTLIFAEDLPLKKEGELALLIRLMISEGVASYQRSVNIEGEWCTEVITLEGPISIVSTSAIPKIEKQLGDRLIKMHPDISEEQTKRVLQAQANAAAGIDNGVDEKWVKVWQHYYDSLEPYPVVVTFAPEIIRFLESQRNPIAARRAFSRVVSAVKTVTIVHQRQRTVDNKGRLVAEMPDYSITRQLLNPAFIESVRGGVTHTDTRMQAIQAEGKMNTSSLAKREDCTPSNISQWAKPLLEAGTLAWCDEMNNPFDNPVALKRAKPKGKAYLCIPGCHGLPTPYDLTNDPAWLQGGELFKLYDLELDCVKVLSPFQESDRFWTVSDNNNHTVPVQ